MKNKIRKTLLVLGSIALMTSTAFASQDVNMDKVENNKDYLSIIRKLDNALTNFDEIIYTNPNSDLPSDQLDKAVEAVEKAESSKKQEDVDDARKLVSGLPEGEERDALEDRLDTIQAEIDEEDTYRGKIIEIEKNIAGLQETSEIAEVQSSIDELEDSEDKARLQAMLDYKAQEMLLVEITEEVRRAEVSKKQEDVDSARELVNSLPDGKDKEELSYRLDVVEGKIEEGEMLDFLNKQLIAEKISEIEGKLAGVEGGDKEYSRVIHKELESYIENLKEEIDKGLREDYLEVIKELDDLAVNFDELIYGTIEERREDLRIILNEEREDVNSIIRDRVIYNEDAVNRYKFFIDGFIQELESVEGFEELKVWRNEIEVEKEKYLTDRFNLEGRDSVEKEIYEIEEIKEIIGLILTKVDTLDGESVELLVDKNKELDNFINSVRRLVPDSTEEIDSSKLNELMEESSSAIAEVMSKVEVNLGEAPEKLVEKLEELDEVKDALFEAGRFDDIFKVNNIILNIKARILTEKTSDRQVNKMINDIDSLINSLGNLD